MRRLQLGFTLIELMVTILVVAVLLGLATPNIRDLIDKSRLRGATDDMVSLLNNARASAVKLQRSVNVSINTGGWCMGAISGADPGTVGDPVPTTVAPCDCTLAASDSSACYLGGTTTGQYTIATSASYSGATISGVDSKIDYSTGALGKGVTFDSKFGSLNLSALPGSPLVKVTSPLGRYSTQISLSALGQTYVCVPSGSPFVAGYPSC
jgi:type IV fimbrial biogenesis protein FimT